MGCEGFEPGTRVISIVDVPIRPHDLIRKGSFATIMGIDHEAHTVDVEFDNYGRVNNVDAYIFKTPENSDQ